MKILIVGGSNSLMKGGYVSALAHSLQAQGGSTISQISVGATTTLSGVGRLFDTYTQASFDFILYEYSINDTGHFAAREGGDASWLLCLHLLIKTAAKLYPGAVLVPLMLAQARHFSLEADYPFHAMQRRAFTQLALPYIDMREALSELFLDRQPDWLYSDQAHYAAPQATDLVGAMVARRLLTVAGSGPEPLSATCARLLATSPFAAIELAYVPAVNLRQFTSGPVDTGHAGNRLMQLDYLRLHPGARLHLRTEMFPLALFVKSDANHDRIALRLREGEAAPRAGQVGVRHTDTDSFSFIYSSIPLPLLWQPTLVRPFGASELELTVPARGDAPPPACFDCFGAGRAGAADPYLDLISVLFVVDG
ncbi:MAG: SGNH/GDSL hydrolase family protein [Pseudomonadota bacterium]